MKKKLLYLWRGGAFTFTFLSVLSISLSTAAYKYSTKINEFLNTSSFVIETNSNATTKYYSSDFDKVEDVITYRESVIKEISTEGSVLLKNDNKTLPITGTNPKVTLLGMGSYDPCYGEVNGSGKIRNRKQIVSLVDCFKKEGFELNPTMTAFYEDKSTTYFSNPKSALLGGANTTARIGEVPLNEYTSAQTNSYKDYDDAAIVILRRQDGEGSQLPSDPAVIADGDGVHNYTELQQNELDLIEHAKANFSKVIVIVNSASAMCIDDLKNDPQIGAILQVGGPGIVGFYGVADLLLGKANPSGGLPFTFPTDSMSSPAMQNTVNQYSNKDEINNDSYGANYIVEAEGIYVGYKYYETRYEDCVYNRYNAADGAGATQSSTKWNYDDEVSYSFGYGLSYTTFAESIDSLSFDKDNVTAKITVKNTGDVAGKHATQLYVQTPYTAYDVNAGIEKSAIQLVGYEKTKELAPGASETVTVTVPTKYIASWDKTAMDGTGAYTLEGGNYYFTVGNGSHDALNNVLTYKGKLVSDGMDYAGDKNKVKSTSISATTLAYSDNGTRVSNQFEDMDYNYYSKNSVTYLSRSNWSSTFPKNYSGLTATKEMLPLLQGNTYKSSGKPIEFEYGKTQDMLYTAAMYRGLDYDDPMYDKILDQLTLSEIATMSITSKPQCDSIVLPRETGSDGPNGLNSTFNQSTSYPYYIDPETATEAQKTYNMGCYQSSVMTAATFSHEMAEKQARAWGNDSLWCAKTHLSAPAVNIIRTPFNGRNSEYMSEDSQLSNLMAIDEVRVFQGDYGGISNVKHFAFYETETNRTGLGTWNTEQAAREIYLRAFQGAFEDSHAHQCMGAFPRIGVKQCNYSSALLTNVLRGEWGFVGSVGTDNGYVDLQYPELSIMAGTDGFIDRDGKFSEHVNEETLLKDGELAAACRETAHRAIWQFANSNMVNGYAADSVMVPVTPWWKKAIIGVDIAFGSIAVAFAAMYVISLINAKKEEE